MSVVARSSRYRVTAVDAAAVGVLALAGCHYRGVGEVRSATGSGTAEFVFNLSRPTGGNTQHGTLNYVDRPAGVVFVARVSGPPNPSGPPGYQTCEPNDILAGQFTGTYISPTGAGGTFNLDVNPSLSKTGATFSLQLHGGPYDGYTNSGPVVLGSIKTVGGPNG